MRDIYNDAWAENWGFVRLSDTELSHLAKGLRPMLEPSLATIVEVDGEPREQAVAIGMSDGLVVEVVGGLDSGDVVLDKEIRKIE